MPKTRRRTGKPQANNRSAVGTVARPRPATVGLANRPSFFSPVVRGPQSLMMPGMVAAGCWLMAFTLFFLSTDPNRNLFGGMAVLMALLWSFSVGIRVRKLMAQRQKL